MSTPICSVVCVGRAVQVLPYCIYTHGGNTCIDDDILRMHAAVGHVVHNVFNGYIFLDIVKSTLHASHVTFFSRFTLASQPPTLKNLSTPLLIQHECLHIVC